MIGASRALLPRLIQHCRHIGAAGLTNKPAAAAAGSAAEAAAAVSATRQLQRWAGFDVGIEQAETLPASFYTSPAALQLEKQHVLYNSWQMVCSVSQLQQAGDFVCSTLADVRLVVVRGKDGQLRAFHNVCRHHAAAVAQGCGNQLQFECPYHGWTYDDRGRLVKATRLKGIQDFKAAAYGLHPIQTGVWGQFVFVHLQGGSPAAAASAAAPPGVADWLAAGGERLVQLGMADASLCWLARREYVINCNWKVFCDNYLDGGYHVPHAHPGLTSGLDLSSYRNELFEVLSVQSCGVAKPAAGPATSSASESVSSPGGASQQDRLAGRDAGYAFVYPNLMVNRYGPWMDTNVVVPLTGSSVDKCRVVFDYWLEKDALARAGAADDDSSSSSSPSHEEQLLEAGKQSQFVAEALASSHQVQLEDISLCEAVQLGLQSPAYGVGRYAPGPEGPMYHFHRRLYGDLMKASSAE